MYSWHKDYYHKAFNRTYTTFKKKLAEAGIELVDFWPWVEANHPDAFKKYTAACDKISSLCKDNSPAGMEEFKKATKTEMDATEWFIDRYIEAHKKLQEAAA